MLWPPLQRAYALVHQTAQILANQEQHTGTQVREHYLAHVRQMQERSAEVGPPMGKMNEDQKAQAVKLIQEWKKKK